MRLETSISQPSSRTMRQNSGRPRSSMKSRITSRPLTKAMASMATMAAVPAAPTSPRYQVMPVATRSTSQARWAGFWMAFIASAHHSGEKARSTGGRPCASRRRRFPDRGRHGCRRPLRACTQRMARITIPRMTCMKWKRSARCKTCRRCWSTGKCRRRTWRHIRLTFTIRNPPPQRKPRAMLRGIAGGRPGGRPGRQAPRTRNRSPGDGVERPGVAVQSLLIQVEHLDVLRAGEGVGSEEDRESEHLGQDEEPDGEVAGRRKGARWRLRMALDMEADDSECRRSGTDLA